MDNDHWTPAKIISAVRECALSGKKADIGLSQLLFVCDMAEQGLPCRVYTEATVRDCLQSIANGREYKCDRCRALKETPHG